MVDVDWKRMGAYIAARRKELGLSQEGLAKQAKTHQCYISQIESGLREPSIPFVGKLADALQVPPAWLCQWAYEDPYLNDE